MTQVFISYSRRDLAFVEQLAADLQAADLDVWYDLSGLEGGARWSREIQKAIRESQYVLVVLSPDSAESKWVEEESLYASELGKKIIPLHYKPCELPFGYRTLHFINVQGVNYKRNFDEILRTLDLKPIKHATVGKAAQEEESHDLSERQPVQNSVTKEFSVPLSRTIVIIGSVTVLFGVVLWMILRIFIATGGFFNILQLVVFSCVIPLMYLATLVFAFLIIRGASKPKLNIRFFFSVSGGILSALLFAVIDLTVTGFTNLSVDPTNASSIIPFGIISAIVGYFALFVIELLLRHGKLVLIVFLVVWVSLVSAYCLIRLSELRAVISLYTIAFIFGNFVYMLLNFRTAKRMFKLLNLKMDNTGILGMKKE